MCVHTYNVCEYVCVCAAGWASILVAFDDENDDKDNSKQKTDESAMLDGTMYASSIKTK